VSKSDWPVIASAAVKARTASCSAALLRRRDDRASDNVLAVAFDRRR